jgi:hypothetical protein
MEPVFDKNIAPNIKVVDTLNKVKTERLNMSGCLLIGVLLVGFLTYVLLSNPMQHNI